MRLMGMGWDGDGTVFPALGTSVALAAWLHLRACAKDSAAAGVRDCILWPLPSPSLPILGPGSSSQR